MEETTWRKSYQDNPPLQEGFNLPGDDYFINVKRQISIKTRFGKLIEQIKKLLKKIPNPLDMADKGLETFLKTLLLLMIGQVDCKTGKLKTVIPDAGEATFTWANGQLGLLKKNSAGVKTDFVNAWNTTKDATKKIKKGWKDNIESFSMPDSPDLIYTIQSFLTNHPKLDKEAVTTYYLKKLNAYEKSLGSPPTSDQLFVFNNEFDNILADSSVVGELKSIANSIPEPSYPNTAEGFADYLQDTARFSFSSDTPITFYPFATQYFPYPTDLQGFEAAIQNVEDPDYVKNINQYLSSLTKPADPPATPLTPTDVDVNYAFSIDLNSTRTESIQTYLKYISQWYGLLLYYKYKKSIAVLFPAIEANVCMVYITYLNAVEYTKYRIYSTYLTPYEMAMFNHLFFICLMQDQLTFALQRNLNVYNLALPLDGVTNGSISNGTPTVYINLLPQSIFSLVRMFAMEINNRLRYLSGSITVDNYQPLPLDGTLILPPVPNDVIPPVNVLLANYILGMFSPTPFNGVSIPEDVVPAKAITDYYFPPGMSKCQQENDRMQKECEEYAKKIKGEIYRMICVPIMVYVVYNFYYMFFFKDCFDLVKKTDDAGNMIYEHKCMDCFTPIFPDWEMMYRSFEQRQTDFLFEFIFKPVKMVYTILNAVKAFFRKGFFGYVIKDNVPYLFFLWTFTIVYRFMTKRADIILNTLKTLAKLKIPDVQIMGRKALDSYAKGVTVFFFFFSFLNKFFGISISEIMECIYNAYLARKAAKEAAALVTKQLEGTSDVGADIGADLGAGLGADTGAGLGAGLDAGLGAGLDTGLGAGLDAGLDTGLGAGVSDLSNPGSISKGIAKVKSLTGANNVSELIAKGKALTGANNVSELIAKGKTLTGANNVSELIGKVKSLTGDKKLSELIAKGNGKDLLKNPELVKALNSIPNDKKNDFLSKFTGNNKTFDNVGISGGAGPDNSKSVMGNCTLQGAAYENSWVKWIMTPGDGPFTKLIKIVCAIIYWILKFSVSMNMVKLSKTIFSLYFLVNAVLGIGNFTTPLQSSSYKVDLIHRIFYTKLCSSNWRTEPMKYFAKCFVFIPIYFLVELVLLHNLMKGINNYSSMSSNKKEYNTGLSAKTNDDADKNSMAVKTFMMILNGLLVMFVLLWSIYKARYKMPNLARGYEDPTDPSIDKRLEYDCSGEVDEYAERSQNRVIKTMMKSDEFNKAFVDQFEMRTAGMKKPSALGGFITKMGEYGKQINDKLTGLGEMVGEYKEGVFGKKDPDAEPGMISKIAS